MKECMNVSLTINMHLAVLPVCACYCGKVQGAKVDTTLILHGVPKIDQG